MEDSAKKQIKIVVVDDDLAIRYALKALLKNLGKRFNLNLSIYTSGNGVEGLGNIYAVNPDIIVLDTTLPKYSGKEVVDFISSHLNYSTKEIIILHENSDNLKLPGHFKLINKEEAGFTRTLTTHIKFLVKSFNPNISKESEKEELNYTTINNLIHTANKADMQMHNITRGKDRFFGYIKWIIFQFLTSINLFILNLRYGNIEDANIDQREKDTLILRVKTYPTLLTVFVAFLFLLSQFVLFMTGGFLIFNYELVSIFAIGPGEKGLEYKTGDASDYIYDSGKIEFTTEGARLKGTTVEVGESEVGPTEATPEVTDTVDPTTETPTTETPAPTATSIPEEMQTPSPAEGGTEVLGIEDQILEPEIEQTSPIEVTTYPTDKPSIVTKNGVVYTRLEKIIERSSINGDESSIQSPSSFENDTDTNITYQLSPDSLNWYYYSETENRWSKTEADWVSSNTVQEINNSLDLFSTLFESGELYIKAFLHSNGSKNVLLKEIVIEKETELLTAVDNTLPIEPELEEVIVGSLDFDVLQVEIFNAAYFDGNKVVKGKVLLRDKKVKAVYQITEEELETYQANIYFYDSAAGGKGELIGTTDLYINNSGEIEFLLRTPSKPGGLVIAEVVLKDNPEIESPGSKPAKS